jgi:hypothetical protein
MRPVSAAALLQVWEEGVEEPLVRRALRLLAAACPDATPESLARLSIGERDRRLLTLREWTFGPSLSTEARCPDCGERLEMTFDVALLRGGRAHDAGAEQHDRPSVLAVGDYELRFRLVTSDDLEVIAGVDAARAAPALLERCVDTALHKGKEVALDRVPPAILEALEQEMARRDPDADLEIGVSCVNCHQSWQVMFDIASYFWSELDVWAARLLREVHTLASAYAWSEADILGMSPLRRRCYLHMVSG